MEDDGDESGAETDDDESDEDDLGDEAEEDESDEDDLDDEEAEEAEGITPAAAGAAGVAGAPAAGAAAIAATGPRRRGAPTPAPRPMTPGERAAKMTDRPSRYFVIASVAIFVAILLVWAARRPRRSSDPGASADGDRAGKRVARALVLGRPVRLRGGQRVAGGIRVRRPVRGALGRSVRGAVRGSQRASPISLPVLIRA